MNDVPTPEIKTWIKHYQNEIAELEAILRERQINTEVCG